MNVRQSKFKIEKETKENLVVDFHKVYNFEDYPGHVFLLMHGHTDPKDGTTFFPMPYYKSPDHLPVGMAEYKLGRTIYFDGFPITFSVLLEEQIDSGVIMFSKGLIRILPLSEFNHRYVIDGTFK